MGMVIRGLGLGAWRPGVGGLEAWGHGGLGALRPIGLEA